MDDRGFAPAQRWPRVLVVDDDVPTLRMIEFVLQDEGYEVAGVPNGMVAIGECMRQLPDILLLNVVLPDSDGFIVHEQVRGLGYRGPVVFVTARPDIREILRLRQMESSGCLVKPLHPDEVVDVVSRMAATVAA